MVRQITVTLQSYKVEQIYELLRTHKNVHNPRVFHGDGQSMIVFNVVNKKTDLILDFLARYGIGINSKDSTIDVVALTSTKPRITTFRGNKIQKVFRDRFSERMSYDEMLDLIDSQIHLTFDYLALIVVGALICANGLLTNSSVSVVASMLVSPLMGPIVGMTFGTIVKNKAMFWLSFRNELIGILVCWLSGVVMGFAVGTFFDKNSVDGPLGHNTQMQSRGTIEGLYWGAGVAIPSGLGVALGVSSYQISALIGVAISAALLPPIVNSGVCVSAALVFYFRDGYHVNDDTHTWFITGCLSMVLFLMNWILVYSFGLLMFHIKNLTQPINVAKKHEFLNKFNQALNIVSAETLLGDTSNNFITTNLTNSAHHSKGNLNDNSNNVYENPNVSNSSFAAINKININALKQQQQSSSAHNLNLDTFQDISCQSVLSSQPSEITIGGAAVGNGSGGGAGSKSRICTATNKNVNNSTNKNSRLTAENLRKASKTSGESQNSQELNIKGNMINGNMSGTINTGNAIFAPLLNNINNNINININNGGGGRVAAVPMAGAPAGLWDDNISTGSRTSRTSRTSTLSQRSRKLSADDITAGLRVKEKRNKKRSVDDSEVPNS